MSETIKTILERYGFPTACAIILGIILRYDILLPLVEQHSAFLRAIGESQKEIAVAIKEQTQLLYAIQRSGHLAGKTTVKIEE